MSLKTSLLGLGLAMLLAGGAGAAPKPIPLTIVQNSPSLGMAVDFIAQDEHLFEKHGLDVTIQIVNAGDSQVIAALASGGASIGTMTTIAALEADSRGEHLRIVSPTVQQFVVQMLINRQAARKAGITPTMSLREKFEHAKGMTFAVTDVGGGLDLLVRTLAKEYGIDFNKTYEETAIHSYPGMLAACKRGQIDIAVAAIPFGTLGIRQFGLEGFADFWSGAVPEFQGAVHEAVVVTDAYAKQNPDVVARLHAALNDAFIFMHQHPNRTVKDLEHRYSRVPAAVLHTLVVQDQGYPATATVTRKGFDIMRRFVAHLYPVVSKLTYDEMVLPIAREK